MNRRIRVHEELVGVDQSRSGKRLVFHLAHDQSYQSLASKKSTLLTEFIRIHP